MLFTHNSKLRFVLYMNSFKIEITLQVDSVRVSGELILLVQWNFLATEEGLFFKYLVVQRKNM